VTKLCAGGTICIFAQISVDAVVDVSGHLPLAETFTALPQPARLMDTRAGETTVDGQAPAPEWPSAAPCAKCRSPVVPGCPPQRREGTGFVSETPRHAAFGSRVTVVRERNAASRGRWLTGNRCS